MDSAKDLRDFLMTRRARITPADVGLPTSGRRRVPGLRREEVALLAGVSAEYYVQVERGAVHGMSDEVLHAIATALRLDEVEIAHLFDLARARARRAERRTTARVPESVQALMDHLVHAPAIVQNGRLDVLAWNQLGGAIYAPALDPADGTPNLARFIFLDPDSDALFPEWERAASDAAALLRVEAGRAPYSKAVTGLVGELATRSEDFRRHWAAHDVRVHGRGTKHFRHEAVGDLTLRFESLQLAGTADLSLVAYTAEPASPSYDALRLLASWAAPAAGQITQDSETNSA